jgi:hypothetical protein
MAATLSVIVPIGFINQKNEERPERGDEFDHCAAIRSATQDVEIIIVDRAYPDRWDHVERAFDGKLGNVMYVPPKPSKVIGFGYRAASSMRNSGALVSTGSVLAFVDDFCWLDGAVADEVCKQYLETGDVLCPLFHDNQEPQIPQGKLQRFSGHSPAVYMCTREAFADINGFDENFDGAYGEEDTEFEVRLDRYLWLRGQNNALRLRRRGLFWKRTWHKNGHLPGPRMVPWPGIDKDNGYLRCNRGYFQAIAHARTERNDTKGNVVPTEEEINKLRHHRCLDTCGVCVRGDREHQLAAYTGLFRTDDTVGERMREPGSRRYGGFDPWKDELEQDA